MNQKDIKEIAGIIKEISKRPDRKALVGDERLFGFDKAIRDITNKLADYFEREDAKCSRCIKPMKKEFDKGFKREMWYCRTFKVTMVKNIDFNLQRFLKDCGVKEK